MEERHLICIGCPVGCALTVKTEQGAVISVEGNTCKRGREYGEKEVTAPARTVTTTVTVTGGKIPAVSLRTRKDIPKEKIFDCIRALKGIQIPAPVHTGDIILADVAKCQPALTLSVVMFIIKNSMFSQQIYKFCGS